jgi:hypothetical protein
MSATAPRNDINMTNTIELLRITGIVTTAPVLSHDDIVEFVVADDFAREYLVRLPRTALGAHVAPGVRVQAAGQEGWKVPGRGWRHEPSRTLLQANDVQLAELALAA